MSKSLTLSMSLAIALGFSGVSFAGHHGSAGCETCGLASPQGYASPQASPQGYTETCGTCGGSGQVRKVTNTFLGQMQTRPLQGFSGIFVPLFFAHALALPQDFTLFGSEIFPAVIIHRR